MEQMTERLDENLFPDWTVEEFDAIEENHVFSRRYRRGIKRIVRSHRKIPAGRVPFPAAAAVAAACIALSVCVYAVVTHGDFFHNAFGNAGRQSVAAHEEMVEDGKGGQVAVMYPEREYVAVNEETAEDLIGTQTSGEPVCIQINDHTLTIDHAVRDENAIIMEFTIDCDTGVKALKYSAEKNEAKGASFSEEESSFYFKVSGAAANIYVDLEKTTDTSLHAYYYGLFVYDGPLPDGKTPVLDIYYTDGLFFHRQEDDIVHEKHVQIPAAEAVQQTRFTSGSGGDLELSPISLKLDMAKGLAPTAEEACDPWYLETISIDFADGSTYQVENGPENIDNTAYICGGLGSGHSEIAMVFNRLIDPADIERVVVNGVIYTAT